jgi:hypothetical protein
MKQKKNYKKRLRQVFEKKNEPIHVYMFDSFNTLYKLKNNLKSNF